MPYVRKKPRSLSLEAEITAWADFERFHVLFEELIALLDGGQMKLLRGGSALHDAPGDYPIQMRYELVRYAKTGRISVSIGPAKYRPNLEYEEYWT